MPPLDGIHLNYFPHFVRAFTSAENPPQVEALSPPLVEAAAPRATETTPS